jgi:rSAM/selenodomain-associated transferase 1
MTETAIAILAKAPVPGTVRTPLIPVVGAEGAATLYERCTEHAIATAVEADIGPVELWCRPSMLNPFFAEMGRKHPITLRVQGSGDLGMRLFRTFEALLSAHPQAIVMGSNCPAVMPVHLRMAAEALADGYDAAFIPMDDGRCALGAMGKVEEEVFKDLSWTTGTVMEAMVSRLRAARWRWLELPTLWDLDAPGGFARLAADPLLKHLAEDLRPLASAPASR